MNFKLTTLHPFGIVVEPLSNSACALEVNVQELRALFQQHQLVVLRGFQTFQSAEEFASYCEKWGEISIWPFGKVLELVEHEKPGDHIFDSSYVPMHWDGMYRPQVPEYQIFHCVKAPLPGKGGRTTFSNTILALKNASDDVRSLWSKTTGVYKREMEFYKSRTVSPLITPHPLRGYSVLRYNEPHTEDKGDFVNPPDIEFRGVEREQVGEVHRTLKQALYAPENFYAHEWETGDIVIADNLTLLHGREGFESKSPRHIRRVQVLSDPPYQNPGLESYQ